MIAFFSIFSLQLKKGERLNFKNKSILKMFLMVSYNLYQHCYFHCTVLARDHFTYQFALI